MQLFLNGPLEIRKEIVYLLTNICSDGRYLQVVIQQGALRGFLMLLTSNISQLVSFCLKFLAFVMTAYKDSIKLISDAKGVEIIESLRKHEDKEISSVAENILKTFFHNQLNNMEF